MTVRGRVLSVIALLVVCGLTGTALAAIPSLTEVTSWTTYRHDSGRSGIDPYFNSPVTPTQAWQTPALDGPIWGQPLVDGGTVYVATENDTVYALSASTGAIEWHTHLATAVPSGQLSCGDISPTVGITSTPVIDPVMGRIYVVADTWDGSNASSIAHEMFALNLSDGSVAVGPVSVEPPADTPKDQLQRASLALDAGKIIIGYGGNSGDCGSYHGWLVAVPESGGSLQTFEVDPSTQQGAIWGAGNAPAIDSAGDIWISTGNGGSGSFGYQESVIKLDSNLNVLDWWAPSNWATLDSSDLDLGSSTPVLLPDGLVFEIGKAGMGYLLDGTNLGRTNTGPPLYSASVCSQGSWGGGIYVNGVIYVACRNGLYALSLNTTAKTFAPLTGWTVNTNASGPPTYAGGLVWAASAGVSGGDNGTLYGLDPSTGATRFSADLGGFEHFATPSAGGGKLFVANDDMVTAFQIATPPSATPTSLALASTTNPVRVKQAVTYRATITPTAAIGPVTFSDNGQGIPGCSAVALSAGQATCTTSYSYAKAHTITATYSGNSSYGGSSATLTERVTTAAPVFSHLKVRVVKGKLRISFVLSLPAKVTAVVAKLVPGRRVGHQCRAGARHGRRCTAALRRATLRVSARKGHKAWRPRMRALGSGRYKVTLTALTSSGGKSKVHRVVITIRG